MDVVDLIRQAQQAGLTLRADGDLLCITGPREAEPLARTLGARKPEVMAVLTAMDAELMWRLDVLSRMIPQHGPIWPPKVRQTPLTDAPGYCTLCGDPLPPERAQSPWRRCRLCVQALWLALNTAREDVSTPSSVA